MAIIRINDHELTTTEYESLNEEQKKIFHDNVQKCLCHGTTEENFKYTLKILYKWMEFEKEFDNFTEEEKYFYSQPLKEEDKNIYSSKEDEEIGFDLYLKKYYYHSKNGIKDIII